MIGERAQKIKKIFLRRLIVNSIFSENMRNGFLLKFFTLFSGPSTFRESLKFAINLTIFVKLRQGQPHKKLAIIKIFSI